MNDLDINIALAEAMGWESSREYVAVNREYEVMGDSVYCNDNGTLRKFDYRNPVIFVAICKRWDLNVHFGYWNVATCYGVKRYKADSIEKAAALCVIDAVKRGVE